jgi:butyrate kinase
MALQISKAIAALACSLSGKIDAILITGALAKSAMLTGWIKNRVAWAAPVEILPGEFEMEALAEGALRVLDGIEKPRIFPSCEFEE